MNDRENIYDVKEKRKGKEEKSSKRKKGKMNVIIEWPKERAKRKRIEWKNNEWINEREKKEKRNGRSKKITEKTKEKCKRIN